LCFWKYTLWEDGKTPELNVPPAAEGSAKAPAQAGLRRALELGRAARRPRGGLKTCAGIAEQVGCLGTRDALHLILSRYLTL